MNTQTVCCGSLTPAGQCDGFGQLKGYVTGRQIAAVAGGTAGQLTTKRITFMIYFVLNGERACHKMKKWFSFLLSFWSA